MRLSAARRPSVLALALLLAATQAAPGRVAAVGASPAQQRVAVVNQLITNVNGRRLAATSGLFTAAATLRVANRQWHGSRAIAAWWQSQFARAIHLSLASSVRVSGNDAAAILKETTRGGDCPTGCWQRTSWQFSGSRIVRMTLLAMPRPPLPAPAPAGTVPPPPQGPPPRVTPTIPT